MLAVPCRPVGVTCVLMSLRCTRPAVRQSARYPKATCLLHSIGHARFARDNPSIARAKHTLPLQHAINSRYGQPSLSFPGPRRHFSVDTRLQRATSSIVRQWQYHKRSIGVGGNGKIQLEVYTLLPTTVPETLHADPKNVQAESRLHNGNEPHSNTQRAKQSSHILIYLPPGPYPEDVHKVAENEFDDLLCSLADSASRQHEEPFPLSTVVKLNYRLLPTNHDDVDVLDDARFPTPIHDTTIGLDWILQNCHSLVPEQLFASGNNHVTPPSFDVQVSIYGRHIGGGLALSLALTNPNMIRSVAVIDPVVDWVCFDEYATNVDLNTDLGDVHNIQDPEAAIGEPRRRRGRASTKVVQNQLQARLRASTAQAMITLRTSLFRTPSGYFDPFASPLFFLRAPGQDTPRWKTAKPEVDPYGGNTNGECGFGPYDDDWHTLYRGDESPAADQRHLTDDTDLDTIAEAIGADVALTSQPYATASHTSDPPGHNSPDTGSRPTSFDNTSTDSTPQIETDLSFPMSNISNKLGKKTSYLEIPQTVKRRKVLRRWPSVGTSDEVLLPYTRIVTTLSTQASPTDSEQKGRDELDLASVMQPQAKEMVDVMQRSCFWGREKTVAETRVTLGNMGIQEDQITTATGKLQNTAAAAQLKNEMAPVCAWLVETMQA